MGADRSAVSRVGRAKKNQLTVTSRPSAEHLFYLLKWVSHSRSLILARLLDLGGGEGEYRDVITPTRAHSRSAKYSDVNQLSRENNGSRVLASCLEHVAGGRQPKDGLWR
ncbi:hypothetical protein J6590_007443 [Homalodisca vitripennis]|nr:hypothetical protein J6590_007443 [Homalodisca vitripennis]